jgi:para-nitrobenzyl esterase
MNKKGESMPIKNEPLVMTTGGVVQGALDGDINVFMGIPYAEPPVGDRRWRPPAPIKISRDPINTPERGSSSFQDAEMCKAIGGGDPTPLNEDCLYLNIWTPNLDETAKPLPVMVWIHGGGYVIGAGKLPPYVGKPLAERQAVVVNINYRLGHLGFFAHPALDRDYHLGKRPVVNNFALLDQIEALKWVQSNITHFGGDPNNVTIFGQSAGGRSVLSLFASPLAGNLFHKGVAQSVYGLPDVPREFALQKGVIVATQLGLPGEDVAPSALRELDADAFWKIPFKPPTPISGDAVLPVPLFDVFKSGNQLRLPLIIGSNSDDSSVLNDFDCGPEKVINLLKERGMHE